MFRGSCFFGLTLLVLRLYLSQGFCTLLQMNRSCELGCSFVKMSHDVRHKLKSPISIEVSPLFHDRGRWVGVSEPLRSGRVWTFPFRSRVRVVQRPRETEEPSMAWVLDLFERSEVLVRHRRLTRPSFEALRFLFLKKRNFPLLDLKLGGNKSHTLRSWHMAGVWGQAVRCRSFRQKYGRSTAGGTGQRRNPGWAAPDPEMEREVCPFDTSPV